jgi:hypothetical protein
MIWSYKTNGHNKDPKGSRTKMFMKEILGQCGTRCRAKCAGVAVILDSYWGDAHFESQVEKQPSVVNSASRHMPG